MLVCAVALTAAPLHAQEPQQQQPQPAQQQREHVVRKGDTLWDLARFYLNDPFRWPMIYEANRPVVENPHWIYPQERIIIPGLMPTVDSMRAPEVVVADVTEQPRRSRFFVEPAPPREPTVLSSEQQRDAIVRPEEWIAAPWLARESELGVLGEIVAPVDPRVNDDQLPHTFHPRTRAYLSFPAHVGNRFLVVRLKHRVTGHGWVVQPMGIVRVDTVGGTTSRAMVISQFADMKVGDLVMPLPQVPTIPTVEPRAVSTQTIGRVIDMLDEQPLYGTTDIAFVDLGASRGLQIGDEVVAFLPDRRISQGLRTHSVPAEPVAQMKIIKVTANTATVRITRVQHAVLEVDMPVRVARQQAP
jgi:hypothetical protein